VTISLSSRFDFKYSFVYLWIYFAGYVAWVRVNSDEVIHVNTYTKGGQKKKDATVHEQLS